MNTENYAVSPLADNCYKFISKGKKGEFEIRILLTRDFTLPDYKLYNLAFGVWNPITGDIDDAVEVRNGDMDRILATVGITALTFLEQNSDVFIYAEGSTSVRTRKYQMGIAAHFADISDKFAIKGLVIEAGHGEATKNESWEHFKKGVNYSAFLLYSNAVSLK